MKSTTLADLLADPASAEPAIIDEAAGVAISHRALADQIERLAQALSGAGLNRGDSVALVLPNGLAFLTLFLALARAGFIAVPLDPAYKASGLRGLIMDVGARAILTGNGNAMVADVAADLALPIWTASVEPTGEVCLAGIRSASQRAPGGPLPDDVALFLHTSGQVAHPKWCL